MQQCHWGLATDISRVDGIVKSFLIQPDEFKITYNKDEKTRVIIIKLMGTRYEHLFGFIRFFWGDDGLGTLQVANFMAELVPSNLFIGTSDKRESNVQARKHGEGLKALALIFRKQGHADRYISRNFSWNFDFDKQNVLECVVARLGGQQKQKILRQLHSFDLKYNPKADILLEVGYPIRKGAKNDNDANVKGQKIELNEVESWFANCLHIQDPKCMIKTPLGDLILDTKFQNVAFLKGMKLSQSSSAGKPLKYGYNFKVGLLGRDRNNLHADEEAYYRAEIWKYAILQLSTGMREVQSMLWLN